MGNKVNVIFTGDMTRLSSVINKTQVNLQKFSFNVKQTFVNLSASVFLAEKAFGALDKVIGSPLKAASKFEDTQLAIRAFMGDVALADDLLDQLDKKSLSTPFEPEDLQATAQALLAAKIEASEIFDVVNELAAVSKDGRQLGELGDAMAKGFAKGKFQTEELNKFLERGINLRGELTKITGKSGDALDKAIQKGLKFDDVRQAIANLSKEGGQFFGMLEQRSETASGKFSTMAGLWTEIQKRFGEPVNNALKPVMDVAIDKMTELLPLVSELGEGLVNMFEAGASAGGGVIDLVQQLYTVLQPFMPLLLGLVALWLAKKVTAIAALKGITVNTASLRAQLAALRLASISAGGGFQGMRAMATVALTGIKAQVMALGAALKSALAVGGVGLALMVIMDKIAGSMSKAQSALSAARGMLRFTNEMSRTMAAIRAQEKKVDTTEGREKVRKRIQDEIQRLKEAKQDLDAVDFGTGDGADERKKRAEQSHEFFIFQLERRLKLLDKNTAAQIADGDARRKSAAAAEAQAKAEAVLQKRLEQSTKEMKKLRDEQLKREAADAQAKLPIAQQQANLLRKSGSKTRGEFTDELNRLSNGLNAGSLTEEEVARFKALLEIRRQLLEVDEKASQASAERKKANADYEQRVKLLQAEIAGDQKKLALLERQARVRELEAGFREKGFTDAGERARRLEKLENEAAGKRKAAGGTGNDSGQSIIAQSLARVGGGGRAFTIDNRVLSESQRQSGLQERIAKATEKSAEKTNDSNIGVFA